MQQNAVGCRNSPKTLKNAVAQVALAEFRMARAFSHSLQSLRTSAPFVIRLRMVARTWSGFSQDGEVLPEAPRLTHRRYRGNVEALRSREP